MNKTTSIVSVIFLILIVVSVGFIFYWFQIRPGQIRKECALNAENKDLSSDYSKYTTIKNFFDQKVYDMCLLEHGLEK